MCIRDSLNSIGTPTALYSALSGIGGIIIVGLILNVGFMVLARLTISRGLSD